MKNVHILSTDKPSRLHLAYDKYYYLSVKPFTQLDTKNYKSFHIYITSDEEIKDGDWYLTFLNKEVIGKPRKCEDSNWNFSGCKKIILTTDQDLIKDGVQAIDDEFLEWFVKNPNCEKVEVENYKWSDYPLDYKIIIPKEKLTISDEAKQRAKNYMSLKGALEPKQETLTYTEAAKKEERIFNSTMKSKETLEEAAEINSEKHHYAFGQQSEFYQLGFIEGTKWQAERMYSEEEVIAIVEKSRETGLTAEYLLLTEQFKKK